MQEPLGLLIFAARSRIKQAVGARVRRFGLTPPQFWLLVALHESGPLSLCELAEKQRMDQPTASRVVAALVRRRLVRATDDPRDRRRSRLSPTPAGRQLAGELEPIVREIRAAPGRDLSPAECETLRTLLRRVIDSMDGSAATERSLSNGRSL
jgi:MarR family transcriptional regulator, transcriptional regulator for hemolysin